MNPDTPDSNVTVPTNGEEGQNSPMDHLTVPVNGPENLAEQSAPMPRRPPSIGSIRGDEDRVVLEAFHNWAFRNLGQGYSLEREEGEYTCTVTRWAYAGWKAAMRQQAERTSAVADAVGLADDGPGR
jgi:hypothetical protein